MRVCKEFKNVKTLKSVYFASECPTEYASVVWHPYRRVYVNRIESIQTQFVIQALRRRVRRDENFRLPPYLTRCESIGIESLERYRINACLMFVFDLLFKCYLNASMISLPTVREENNRPVRRQIGLLRIDWHRADYGQYEPINNMYMIFLSMTNLQLVDQLF